MGLWLWENIPPMTFALADEATEIEVALIRAGAWDEDDAACEVIDFAAVRAARDAH